MEIGKELPPMDLRRDADASAPSERMDTQEPARVEPLAAPEMPPAPLAAPDDLSAAAFAHLQHEAAEHPKFHRPPVLPMPTSGVAVTSAPVVAPTNAGPKPTPVQWTRVPLPFTASTMLQSTDGRVLAQDEASVNWWALTPNAQGSYKNGEWTQLAPMSKARLYYSSSVLNDGRILVAGGEYTAKDRIGNDGQQTEDNTVEIYDPLANTWTTIPGPGWRFIGDAPSAILTDGRVLMGSIVDNKTAIYDPVSHSWADGGTKQAPSAEESWVRLRDNTILTVDCDPSRAQRSALWVPKATGGQWIDAGLIPVSLVEDDSQEIGPALTLHDNRVFVIGATGHTAFYTPSKTPGTPGVWTAGPDLPLDAAGKQIVAKDAPAVLMPNGRVLFTGASVENADDYGSTTSFFSFDPKRNIIEALAAPAHLDAQESPQSPYEGRFMLPPTGEAMFVDGSKQVSFFPKVKDVDTSGAPKVTSAPTSARAGETITIAGRRLTGTSQVVAYGDDASAALNFPLVRLVGAGKAGQQVTHYLRTSDFSTPTDAKNELTTARVTVPTTVPPGSYRLQVVTGAIPSNLLEIRITAPKEPTTNTPST